MSTADLHSLLERELNCSVLAPSTGSKCRTDKFGMVFVKTSNIAGARSMFDGEVASVEAIEKTNVVRLPKPIKVFDKPGDQGSVIVMEYLDIQPIHKHAAELGQQLANLHLHNKKQSLKDKHQESSIHREAGSEDGQMTSIEQYGFHTTTWCGLLTQDNTWEDDWLDFFARHKLKHQLDIIEKEYGDREAQELWGRLERKLPQYFKDVEIFPSLLHGDLWSGNAADMAQGPVIYDAASFYGHHEYDLGIAKMFGGFSSSFWNSYHAVIPKGPGFNQRNQLYQLFHHFNHWNVFGSGYRESSLALMKQLC